MKSNLTRHSLITACILACLALALTGCANQQQPGTPTTQPTTQPVNNGQTAHDVAQGIWQNITAAAAIAEAVPGLIPPPDVALMNLAIAAGDKALATWQAHVNDSSAVTLQAEFYALLPDVARIVADAKAKSAGTTTAALRAKSLHR